MFKTECLATTVFHDGPYQTLADVEYAVAGWVDRYNHRRLHGSLGMLTPTEYEQEPPDQARQGFHAPQAASRPAAWLEGTPLNRGGFKQRCRVGGARRARRR